MKRPVVLKLGGELIEGAERLKAIGKVIKQASKTRPLIVVHGGGREIDASLAQVGIPKRQVDGLRVTDPETLEIVVSVLAGSINTRFVAAINAAGGRAIGLTGADAGVAPVKKAAPHKATSGDTVDLGMVGTPVTRALAPELLTLLCNAGYVPVIACVSASKEGQLFNVNADTLAGSLASRVKAKRLVIAGATAGVLDKRGQTIPRLNQTQIAKLVTSGTANAGMVAKLSACQAALAGASSVVIIDGRDARRIAQAVALEKTSATSRIVK
ncbi:MAG: acetylglutamate kinase [Acidobacteria bacterium]|nr:acetylglutamate kinase [Acidobacteriota bacterium]